LVQSIKVTDAFIQSLLFIAFSLLLTNSKGIKLALLGLLIWQLLSFIVHNFLDFKQKRARLRIYYIIAAIPYYVLLYFYLVGRIKDVYVSDLDASGFWNVPVVEIGVFGLGILLALYYFTICFREIKVVLRKIK